MLKLFYTNPTSLIFTNIQSFWQMSVLFRRFFLHFYKQIGSFLAVSRQDGYVEKEDIVLLYRIQYYYYQDGNVEKEDIVISYWIQYYYDQDGNVEKEEKLPENHLGRVYFNLRQILNLKSIYTQCQLFLLSSTWKINIVVYSLLCRYDKTSECLAVRILNIKNIPRNNKDVSMLKEITWLLSKIPKYHCNR